MYERIDKNLSEEAGFVLPDIDVNQALALLQSWHVEQPDEREEQRETWEYLKMALDEDSEQHRRAKRSD